ncbi:MAG: hypothetical protein RL745_807 [Actinomycetota bacterium]
MVRDSTWHVKEHRWRQPRLTAELVASQALSHSVSASAHACTSSMATHSSGECANAGSPGPKFTAGIPIDANRATSVHPSFGATAALATRLLMATSSAKCGWSTYGIAPPAQSTISTSKPANTSRTCACAAASSRSGANR